jgi:general stress protein YciG
MATKTSDDRSGDSSGRGFASMDEEQQREIARKGGESVAPEDRSFSKDHELAAEAGRKGGQSVAPEDRSFSKDHELAAEAGRKGGESSHGGGSGSSNGDRSRGGNFADNPERAAEAGRKGGRS